jgi:hypothetical protein
MKCQFNAPLINCGPDCDHPKTAIPSRGDLDTISRRFETHIVFQSFLVVVIAILITQVPLPAECLKVLRSIDY